jgi:hypothetical protein
MKNLAFLFLFAAGAFSSDAQAQTTNEPITKVFSVGPKRAVGEVSVPNGNAFSIASSGGNCALLTAGHINKDVKANILLVWDANNPNGFEVGNLIADVGADVVLAGDIRGDYINGCPPLPLTAAMDSLLTTGLTQLRSTTPQGEIVVTNLDISRITASHIYLRSRNISDRITAGMSGSPIFASGRAVAIFQRLEEDGSTVRALRLDALPAAFKNRLSLSASRPIERSIVKYDESVLPRSIRDLVIRARRTRELAEAGAEAARREAAIARTKSDEAQLQPMNANALNGLDWFRTSNDTGEYSGEVRISSTGAGYGSGYGVREDRSVENFGNKWICFRGNNENTQPCKGNGVVEYATNAGNSGKWASWEGGFDERAFGRISGPGILTFAPSDDTASVYMDRQYNRTGNLIVNAVVYELRDGRRFEGLRGSIVAWDEGVLWRANGSLLCYGFWKRTENGGHGPDDARNRAAGYLTCDDQVAQGSPAVNR